MSIPKLADVGTLSYGAVTFDALKHTSMDCAFAPDASGRATKQVNYTLTVEGVVSIPDNDNSTNIDAQLRLLRKQLSVPGQALRYTGRGFGDLIVNAPGNPVRDVAWGPKPEVLKFQPLGQGRSAMIAWRVVAAIPECSCTSQLGSLTSPGRGELLESTWESNLSYDDDYYTHLTLSGTIEIPLTWQANSHRLADIVDNYRHRFLNNPPTIPDYKVTSREFDTSPDKRTMRWKYTYDEMAPMGTPIGCSKARGSYSVKPQRAGDAGFSVIWNCHLEATYTVRKDWPRRVAYFAFITLLMDRIGAAAAAREQAVSNPNQVVPLPAPGPVVRGLQPFQVSGANPDFLNAWRNIWQSVRRSQLSRRPAAILTNFEIREGVYDDSKTVSFAASWILPTTFDRLLAAAGVFRMTTHHPRLNTDLPLDTDKTVWQVAMRDIQGWQGNYALQQRPGDDLVIDICMCDPAPPQPPYPLPPPARRGTGAQLNKDQQTQLNTIRGR